MLSLHGKVFASSPDEIGCVQPSVVAPMVIFTVPHVPWDLKPIPVPRALLPKLVELLKEKARMGILEPSMAPYSNRWFTVPKKSGALRVHPRYATCQQSDNQEQRIRSNC